MLAFFLGSVSRFLVVVVVLHRCGELTLLAACSSLVAAPPAPLAVAARVADGAEAEEDDEATDTDADSTADTADAVDQRSTFIGGHWCTAGERPHRGSSCRETWEQETLAATIHDDSVSPFEVRAIVALILIVISERPVAADNPIGSGRRRVPQGNITVDIAPTTLTALVHRYCL